MKSFSFLCSFALAGSALAQGGVLEETRLLQGGAQVQEVGSRLRSLPDLDGDGRAEYAHQGLFSFGGGALEPGVRVLTRGYSYGWFTLPLSGFPGSSRSWICPTDDVDGDGVLDLFLGDPGFQSRGEFHLISGSTGAIIYTRHGVNAGELSGQAVLALPDLDGDGHLEVAVGAPEAHGAGRVRIHSGADGGLLQELLPPSGLDFGAELIPTGDVDADGLPDFAVKGEGLTVYSTAAMQVLHTIPAPPGSDLLFATTGSAVLDFDGDGVPDLVVGDPTGSYQSASSVRVYSGADGSQLSLIDAAACGADTVGRGVAPAGDLDHDGREDLALLVYAYDPWGTGAQLLHYSLTEGVLQREPLDDDWPTLDSGDEDLDGLHEVLVGRWDDSGGLGEIRSYRWFDGLRASDTELSSSAGGGILYEVDFPVDAAGSTYQLLFSASGTGPVLLGSLEVPLSADVLFAQCYFGQYPSMVRLSGGVLDAHGDGFGLIYAGPHQIGAGLVGRSFHAAAVCSNGLSVWRYSSIARKIRILP